MKKDKPSQSANLTNKRLRQIGGNLTYFIRPQIGTPILRGTKFSYAAIKNARMIEQEMKVVGEMVDGLKNIKEYREEVKIIQEKYDKLVEKTPTQKNKLDKEREEEAEKMGNDKFPKLMKELQEIDDTESTLTLYKIHELDIPKEEINGVLQEISPQLLIAIIDIIE